MSGWMWSNAEYAERFLGDDTLRCIIDKLPLSQSAQVLDYGCGDGTLTERVAERVPEGLVVGCDRDAAAVQQATRRFSGKGNGIIRHTGTPWLEFSRRRFDVVLCRNVLHFDRRYRQTLSRLADLTTGSGSMYVESPAARSSAERRLLMYMSSRWQPDVWRHYPLASHLRDLLHKIGMSSSYEEFYVPRVFPREPVIPADLEQFVLSSTAETTCYSVLYTRIVIKRGAT